MYYYYYYYVLQLLLSNDLCKKNKIKSKTFEIEQIDFDLRNQVIDF